MCDWDSQLLRTWRVDACRFPMIYRLRLLASSGKSKLKGYISLRNLISQD